MGVLENIEKERIPANFNYELARAFFRECEAVDTKNVNFEFKEPDFEGLAKFLIEENSFQKERVDKYVERLKAAKAKAGDKRKAAPGASGGPAKRGRPAK